MTEPTRGTEDVISYPAMEASPVIPREAGNYGGS